MNHLKTKTQGSALTTILGGVIILAAVLFLLVKLANSGYTSGDVADSSPKAVETRIQPVARLELGDGSEPGQRTGQQVFDKICMSCHGAASQVPFAPKITHNYQWATRIAKGLDTLVKHGVEGYLNPEGGMMPAKGGAADLTNEEVARAIIYMANQSGGHFDEASAGSGGSSAAASDAAGGASKPAAASDAQAENTKADTAKAEDAAPAASGKGKEIFEQSCSACHSATSSVPFAPKLTKKDEWAPRIKQGKDTLYKHAIEGFNGPDGGMMPAKGGNMSISDDDIKAVVDYMVGESGGYKK